MPKPDIAPVPKVRKKPERSPITLATSALTKASQDVLRLATQLTKAKDKVSMLTAAHTAAIQFRAKAKETYDEFFK